MQQMTCAFSYQADGGEDLVVDIRWSFLGSAVQWFGNVSHEGRSVTRIGGRVELAAGNEPSAPRAVVMDAQRELWRRSADVEARLAELREPAPAPIDVALDVDALAVDLELELAGDAARGELLWQQFFGNLPSIDVSAAGADQAEHETEI